MFGYRAARNAAITSLLLGISIMTEQLHAAEPDDPYLWLEDVDGDRAITWVKEQDGGNIYRCDDPPMQGWLCPELFRYFTKTPKTLYVRAEPK